MSDSPKTDTINLKGQVAVVTGGGRGIGRAIAEALASAGAAVAVLARSANELAETVSHVEHAGGRARAFVADVAEAEGVSKCFAEIERSLGPVDLLVNNAATAKPLGPFWENDASEWWRGMEVNVRGPLLCMRAVLPGMISRRRGRIINVVTGTLPLPYFSSYLSSKTALMRLTECIAVEARPFGVVTFALAPGTVRTAMAEFSLNSPEGQKWLPWFRRIFDEGLDVPAERPAKLAVTLASGKADALTGRLLAVADDLDALLKNLGEVEKNDLYTLRLRRLGGANPAASSILSSAMRTTQFTPGGPEG